MNLYFLDQMAKEKMREAERWARETRLKAVLSEHIKAGERRLGVQLGRLTMIWLPLPGWLRLCIPAVQDQVSHCY
jgi:hypothetical protein